MKQIKRFLSGLLMLCMLVSMIPVTIRASESDTRNNQTVLEEELDFTTSPTVDEVAPPLLPDDQSVTDILKVHVTATERDTNDVVSIEGATVDLYVGNNTKPYSTAIADSDGIAKLSLAGLTIEERLTARVAARKIVSRGKGIDGTARDDLFEHFPTEDGEYYRYTMELHSETIDEDGNWDGAKIPFETESNKLDIVFIVDASGSMDDEIKNVKNQIPTFAQNLVDSGLDIRFCLMDYRDIAYIDEDPNAKTHVYKRLGSHWIKNVDSVRNLLASITPSGGGGNNSESLMDPLGYMADDRRMRWRSDAERFAFVFTDADYTTDNNYGYATMEELAAKLAELEIVTSVITENSCKSAYEVLYNTTGGVHAYIHTAYFKQLMLDLSNHIIYGVTPEMTVHLSEPRMLVNMSVCYFADDTVSRSEEYKEGVKNMLKEYSKTLAQATDGHVMIDKILLFSTDNRMDFYFDTKEEKTIGSDGKTITTYIPIDPQIASMADIRIETKKRDDGESFLNVSIHSNGMYQRNGNSILPGFYSNDFSNLEYDDEAGRLEGFINLKDSEIQQLKGKYTFLRIQMGAVTSESLNMINMIKDPLEYSATLTHETGHYLFGFFDEYRDMHKKTWKGFLLGGESNWYRPKLSPLKYAHYGLMDNQQQDIEISKTSIDYAYIQNGFEKATDCQHTYHSSKYFGSCEDLLAVWLTNVHTTDYIATYTKASTKDRTAPYPFAEITEDDFLTVPDHSSGSRAASARSLRTFSDASASCDAVAEVAFAASEDTVRFTADSDVTVGLKKSGDAGFTDAALTNGAADLPIAAGEMAEVRVIADGKYNTYYVDRSGETDAGYFYTAPDNAVMAYVTTDEPAAYTFIADNTGFTNGDYQSMNQATLIAGDQGADFDSGEIYSVANYMAEIDYTTLSWFKYANGEWTALPTDYSEEENMNIGARADLDGEGMYVLMAKSASVGNVLPSADLSYTQADDRDAVVTVTFSDPNADSKYYNVYYSDTELTDKNADNVTVRSFDANDVARDAVTNDPMLTINLYERGRTVHAAVEIVAEDGSRSELSQIVLSGGEADSDGDGIPNWYCNEYLLWGATGEEKDIANSDDDGDGLTNLEEYQGGSDPTNPNDPVHTTNVPVESISVSRSELMLGLGETAVVSAIVMPENASNKNVTWASENDNIANVNLINGEWVVTAVAEGETMIYAVTADGGYAAGMKITVHKHSYEAVVTNPTCTEAGYTTYTCSICSNNYTADMIDAPGHDYEAVVTAPTCIGQGYTTYTCHCGDTYVADYVDIVDHTYENGVCSVCSHVSIAAPVAKCSNIASTGKIKVTWEKVEGAAKYKVYRATSKTGTYKLMKTVTGTSFTNTSVDAGKTYYYYVRAVDADGKTSDKSNIVSRTCDLPRPELTMSNVASSGKIKVSWKAIDGAVEYKVYRATSKDGTYKLVKTTTGTSFTNTSTTAGKTYYYKVKAIASKSAADSAYSEVKSRTCDLARPTVSVALSSNKPKVSWKKVDGAVEYKVYRATSKTGTYSLVKTTTSLSFKNTSATAGKTYYYKVIAVASKSAANSAYSSVVSIKSK